MNYIKKGDVFHGKYAEFIALNDETEKIRAKCEVMFTNERTIYKVGEIVEWELAEFEEYELEFAKHPQNTSTINHPPHYGGESNPYEAIKVIEAWELNFRLGNAVKYISRAGKKTASKAEDLKKAIWYLERELSNEKNI